ncbi:tetratricopeptide repeat-containing sensor histidine kinase [Tenacibaculum haliotis]|uniref:tetratricopeptide repeat-containing sensor histidine kinase n=1 Tax=Tenacibaculum haliotis TaxID=1888914 RepID=UPI0021AF41F3|nr:tetratricopeptide repeat-containing sensor histidine kinase [Tenacibaculum haliotis]MCT4699743.1 tetratricopeptide repeat protein [Tenacibaculum haliotis]
MSQRKYSILYKKYKKKEYFETLKEALKEYELSISKENKYLFSLLIADIYNKTKNYQNALFYYKNSLQILKLKGLEKKQKNNIKNIIEVSKINLRIGSAYQKLTLNDSAVFYYTKVEKLNSFNPVILKHKASTYTNLSGIFERDSLFEKAKEYALQAMNIHSLRKDKVNQANSLNNLGNIYLSQKKFKQAKNIYLQGIDLIKNDNSPNSVRFKANLYYNLAWAMRNLKDYKAYDYQELSYEIEDNQREKEVRRIIEEVTVKHKENLEQQKINLVTEQRKLAETQDSKTSLLFGALSLLVIIISGVVVYNYKLRQKNLQLKLSENNLKQQQSLEKLKSDTHTKILNATIDAKESERKQIAEILHDNVSALLSSANMHLSATKKQFSNNAPQEIEKTQAIILEASQKVRDLSHNLISSILLKFGLEYALKDVVKKYSNSQLKFEISAQNINRYNQEFEIKIFNIIQELANNILKHSKASLAQIIIKQEKNKLTILVNDNGIGFNTSATAIKNTGIGLNQIEARLEMMNGKLSINSATNKGTKISITIPIQQQKPFKLSSVS